MNLTCISDTHGQHGALRLPGGDVLIHAGDISKRGKQTEIIDFLNWFAQQNYAHKIFIAGNHDFYLEEAAPPSVKKIIPQGITYLNDSGIDISGIHFWGSPVQPWFYDWAFNRKPGTEIRRHWEKIPKHTHVLITHGPPRGILDRTVKGMHVGCIDLNDYVAKIKPRLHVFGHIHEAFGKKEQDGITYINASSLDENYKPMNRLVEMQL